MQTQPKHTVLIVDDDESTLKALWRLMASLGVDVAMATSGAEGLAILKSRSVSLIMSDQHMPGMTGVEFLRESREVSPDSIRVFMTEYADIEATIGAINEAGVKYYINKPWDNEILLRRIKGFLDTQTVRGKYKHLQEVTRLQNEHLKDLNRSLQQRVKEQTGEIRAKHQELKQSFTEIIKAFSTIVELRFRAVSSHSQRVGTLVKRLLKSFDLSQKEYQDIVVAAFLHDIGKITLPDKTIAKSSVKFSAGDRELLARHSILGQRCIHHISGLEEVGLLIRNHHENYDGSGYPDGLVGMQIPLGSRLIRIADSFDRRAFAQGYPNAEALNEASAHLVRHSGSKFDPKLVGTFIECKAAKEFFLKESSDTKLLQPVDLREDMVVAVDVHTKNGVFLVPRGARLSNGMISRIRKIHAADPVRDGVQIFRHTQPQKEGVGLA